MDGEDIHEKASRHHREVSGSHHSTSHQEKLSFSDSTFSPYTTKKVKEPARLSNQETCGEFEMIQILDGD